MGWAEAQLEYSRNIGVPLHGPRRLAMILVNLRKQRLEILANIALCKAALCAAQDEDRYRGAIESLNDYIKASANITSGEEEAHKEMLETLANQEALFVQFPTQTKPDYTPKGFDITYK